MRLSHEHWNLSNVKGWWLKGSPKEKSDRVKELGSVGGKEDGVQLLVCTDDVQLRLFVLLFG